MARYIDADNLPWHVTTTKLDNGLSVSKFMVDWEDFYRKTPAADVAPVIHAHWVPIESSLHVEKSGACSECGEAWPLSDTEYFYHCPNCGAKMDEEVE